MRKQKFHYHVCSCGRWKHHGKCNLSHYAHCGFKFANDLNRCVKNQKIAPPLTFESIAQHRIAGLLTPKAFLNEACRLDLNADQAKTQLREYRFKLRRLTKKNAQKSKI